MNAIDHARLRGLVETNGRIALRVIFQLGEDERRLHNWVIGLGKGNAEMRLATMLIDTGLRGLAACRISRLSPRRASSGRNQMSESVP